MVALVPFNSALGGYFNSIVDDKAQISETFCSIFVFEKAACCMRALVRPFCASQSLAIGNYLLM